MFGFIDRRMLVLVAFIFDSAICFSKQNVFKTDLRNSLKPVSLSNLMMISIVRSKSDSLGYVVAFKVNQDESQ